ncbi:MAG: YifB family Mg chelatase-like AAA ATPase [Gammaproteobacteria bacterium]|nr:YifB family Mg chelatase-like AAA ATPase [Gammaproteobacteria bacterium]
MQAPVTYARAQVGITAPQVIVETHLTGGLPRFTIVGLPETAVNESKERVRSALMNSQFEFPRKRITTNLAPADIPKIGGRYDLAIAMGILAASQQVPFKALHDYEFAAELGLSGELRPVSGILSAAIAASEKGRTLVVAPQNAAEAILPEGNKVFACESLLALCQHLQGKEFLGFHEPDTEPVVVMQAYPDLADVCGHFQPKRVLAIAASGAHSLLMVGPPGTGKSLLSHCLPGLLPELTRVQALEVAAIHSLAYGGVDASRWRQAPYCAPHHTSSSAALVGGGKIPKPGLISQAHCGVLFLDELPEFRRDVLEALREPLESGVITVARAAGHVSYPARFQLIAAMNPCPCGYLGDHQHECRCSPATIERYQNKISGPMLDRIDLHVLVRPVPTNTLVQRENNGPTSAEVRLQVEQARALQEGRQGCANSALAQNRLQEFCQLTGDAKKVLAEAIEKFGVSPRSYHRLLRISRTIADLESQELIASQHVAEALSYRNVLGH